MSPPRHRRPSVRPATPSRSLAVVGLLIVGSACGGSDDEATGEPTGVASSSTTVAAAATTTVATTPPTVAPDPTPTVATTTTTTPPTTTTTTTTAPPTTTTAPSTTTTAPPTTITLAPLPAAVAITPVDPASIAFDVETEIGRSVEGRPITVIRRGSAGGTRVIAVGSIHGNEAAGEAIIDRLAVEPVPDGVELWLVRSANPDGVARSDRQNANLVDLNRNFPENWAPLGEPGFWQYGGPSPASEPETRAMVALGAGVRPDVVLWYHQDLFRIAPGTGRSGDIRRRYAEVAGLPVVDITGGTYTGTASQWSRTVLTDGGVGITVELGPTLSVGEIAAHVEAVRAIATEFF